jgi:hypothetical protein
MFWLPYPFFARITSLPWAVKFFSLMAIAGRAAAVRAAFAVIFHVVAVLNMTKRSLSKSIVTQQIFHGTENITNCPVLQTDENFQHNHRQLYNSKKQELDSKTSLWIWTRRSRGKRNR